MIDLTCVHVTIIFDALTNIVFDFFLSLSIHGDNTSILEPMAIDLVAPIGMSYVVLTTSFVE